MSSGTRIIEVRQSVFKQNDIIARALRQRFRDAGVFVVSMVSSPGSGKTTLLRKNSHALAASLSRRRARRRPCHGE